MKIAILSFAHMHANSYASILQRHHGVTLAYVWDEDENRGQQAAKQYNTTYVKDYETILKDADVDAVVICSENAHHVEMVLAAADAQKHILCEKPIATSVEDGKRMVKACSKAGVKFQTAFPMRYNTPIQRVKNQIQQERLGRIVALSGTNRGQNPGGWFVNEALSGGGAVLDHTVHVIDIMRWYTGSEITQVYAEIDTRFSDGGIDDCGLLTLEFQNGIVATHDPSWSRPKTFPTWGDVTLRVIGTGGTVTVDAFAQSFMRYDDSARQARHVMWGDDSDARMVEDFITSVRKNKEPLATGLDGLRAMEVALAAYESAKTGRPVTLR